MGSSDRGITGGYGVDDGREEGAEGGEAVSDEGVAREDGAAGGGGREDVEPAEGVDLAREDLDGDAGREDLGAGVAVLVEERDEVGDGPARLARGVGRGRRDDRDGLGRYAAHVEVVDRARVGDGHDGARRDGVVRGVRGPQAGPRARGVEQLPLRRDAQRQQRHDARPRRALEAPRDHAVPRAVLGARHHAQRRDRQHPALVRVHRLQEPHPLLKARLKRCRRRR